MALAHLKIVEIVRRGNLDRAGTKLGVGVLVGDNGDLAVGQRQVNRLAD